MRFPTLEEREKSEDLALINAIKEGEATETVTKQEIFKLLDDKE